MSDNYGDSVGFPDADADAPCVDEGRLAGVFLRLHRQRFSGLVYVSSNERTLTFAFRAGVPVLAEEPMHQASLGDELVERGLISRDEYAEVIARVTDGLVENEDVAFGEHAVSLGFLSQEQVDAELSKRVRSRLIQAMALTDCAVDLDPSEDPLPGGGEYPQKLGAAVYMGVRTFYEEDVLRSYVPDIAHHYMRLSKTPAEIARFFELDYEEVALLNSVEPQARVASWIERCDLEESHALQLLALLHIGALCEFSRTSFAPPETERSGVRSASGPEVVRPGSRMGMSAVNPASGSRGSMPAVSPGSGSRAAMPGVHPDSSPVLTGSRAAMPAVRSEVYEPRGGSRAGMPAARVESRSLLDPRSDDLAALHSEERSSRRADGSGARMPPGSDAAGARREGSAHGPPRQQPASPDPPPTAAVAPQPNAAPSGDLAAEALAEARARVAREGKRGGTYAAQRLHRALQGARPDTPAPPPSSARNPAVQSGPVAARPEAAAAAAPVARPGSGPIAGATPEYQKAHLKELMQRRQGSSRDMPAVGPRREAPRDPARELRAAQDSLRDGQYARAEEILRGLQELAPNDDVIRTYHLWAQLRAGQPFDPGQLTGLRDLAKKLTSDQEHAGFACYVLGHLFLGEKRDDQAEKYFRKAHAIDKTNKDAERHVVILERRKAQALEGEAAGQRKLFGISFSKKE